MIIFRQTNGVDTARWEDLIVSWRPAIPACNFMHDDLRFSVGEIQYFQAASIAPSHIKL